MIKAWTDEAWEDFEYWLKQDKKTLKRILQLLKDRDEVEEPAHRNRAGAVQLGAAFAVHFIGRFLLPAII